MTFDIEGFSSLVSMCHQIVHLNLSNIHIHEVSGLQKTFVNALTTLTGLYKSQGATTQPVQVSSNVC